MKAKLPRKRAAKKAAPPVDNGSMSDTSCEEVTVTGSDSVKKVPKSRKKFKNELTIRLMAAAKAALAAPEAGLHFTYPCSCILSCKCCLHLSGQIHATAHSITLRIERGRRQRSAAD